MIEKINVQIRQGGKLLKELSEENVIVISEFTRGEMFAHIGIEESVLLLAQLSKEYNHMLEWLIQTFGLDKETAGDLVKAAKMSLTTDRTQVISAPKKAGDDE